MQPSPYFQGEYVTANKKVVDIEDNVIKTRSGIYFRLFLLNSLNNSSYLHFVVVRIFWKVIQSIKLFLRKFRSNWQNSIKLMYWWKVLKVMQVSYFPVQLLILFSKESGINVCSSIDERKISFFLIKCRQLRL